MRKSAWLFGVFLLLTIALMSGCTRAKSSGPPEPTETGVGGPATNTPGGTVATITPGGSVEEDLSATTTAWAVQTATAAAQPSGETEEAPTDTPEAEEAATATSEATPTATSQAQEATEEPEATAEPSPTTAPSSSGGATTHTVQAGENLFRIALQYGLSYQRLAAFNGIANPNIVYVGQVLKIPGSDGSGPEPSPGGPGVHVVQPGENLFRIALQYNMAYTVLARANGLSYPYTVYVGQRLTIP